MTPSISTRAKQSVCSANQNLAIIDENEIAMNADDHSSLTDLFQVDNLSPVNYTDPNLENYFVPGNPNTVANSVTFAEHINIDSPRFMPKLYLFDLLWICCTTFRFFCGFVVDLAWICCTTFRFVADLLWISWVRV